jgi:hypothetical protein
MACDASAPAGRDYERLPLQVSSRDAIIDSHPIRLGVKYLSKECYVDFLFTNAKPPYQSSVTFCTLISIWFIVSTGTDE